MRIHPAGPAAVTAPLAESLAPLAAVSFAPVLDLAAWRTAPATTPAFANALLARVDASLDRTARHLGALQKVDGRWDTPWDAGAFHVAIRAIAVAAVDERPVDGRGFIDELARLQRTSGAFEVTSGDLPRRSVTRLAVLAVEELMRRDPSVRTAGQAIIDRASRYLARAPESESGIMSTIVDIIEARLRPERTGLVLPDLQLLGQVLCRYVEGTLSGVVRTFAPALAVLALNQPTLRDWAHGILGCGVAKVVAEIPRMQDGDGAWGWNDLGTALALLALHAEGHRVATSEPMRRGLGFFESLAARGSRAWTNGDSWDTGLVALTVQSLSPDGIARGARAIASLGDAQLADGRYSFSFTGKLGDNDTTSSVLRAMCAAHGNAPAGPERDALAETIRATATGLLAYQQPDGGWGAFSKTGNGFRTRGPKDATQSIIDDSASPDLTGRVLRSLVSVRDSVALSAVQRLAIDGALARGRIYLRDSLGSAGTWWSRWIAGPTSTFMFTVPVLRRLGEEPSSPLLSKTRGFLLARQNHDGGWGETIDNDRGIDRRAPSSVVHTASAIVGLIGTASSTAVRDARLTTAIERGVAYLLGSEQGGAFSNGRDLYTVLTGLDYYDSDASTTCFVASALALYRDYVRVGPEAALAASPL